MGKLNIVIIDGKPFAEDGRPVYPIQCCMCLHDFYLAKSMAMESGINSGCASCPSCNTFLHVELDPGINGDVMKNEMHQIYVDRELKKLGK